jgi:tetratricopeptide (TPR) repeat protein
MEMNQEALYKNAIELERKGEYSSALVVYKELTSLNSDARYLIAYGVCLQKLQHWKQSIPILEKGISLKPSYGEGDARLFLAEAYLNAGFKHKAIEQWKIVSKMQPAYPSYEYIQNKAIEMLNSNLS